jgi:hypothetical protein
MGIIIDIFLIGLIQDIIAPVMIAIEDRTIIGVLILLSSLIIIHGDEFIGEKIVAIVNRME